MSAPTSSGTTSTARPTFFRSSRTNGRAPLERGVALLRDQREPGRRAGARPRARRRRSRSIEAEARQQASSPGRIVVVLRQVRRVPPRVAGRDRPVDRDGGAEEHRVGERLPVDRVRDRPAQLDARCSQGRCGSAPLRLGFRLNQNESASRPTPEVDQLDPPAVGRPLERRVVLGPHLALGEVDLARLQAQQFGVLVRHDLEREPVEVRQRDACRVLPPVVRVAREDEALARPGTPSARTARGRRSPTAASSGPRPGPACPRWSGRSSLWRGRIGRLSSSRRPGPNGEGNVTTTVDASGADDLQRLAADAQRLAERAAGLLVVDRLEREQRRRPT